MFTDLKLSGINLVTCSEQSVFSSSSVSKGWCCSTGLCGDESDDVKAMKTSKIHRSLLRFFYVYFVFLCRT